jgi:stage V sporulation protein D (sporulation-specific penicillin-binding protein)
LEKKTKKKTAKKVSKGHLKLVKQVDKRKVPEKGTDKKQKPVKTIQRKGAKNTPSKEKQVKKQPVKKISIINRRLKVLLFIFISILVLLLIRIAYIQFIRGEELRIKAFEQQTKTTVISPERGIIYDRNSMELAVNVKVKTITINPVQIKENEIGLDKIANDISEILGSDKESILKKFKKDSLYEIISRKIDVEVSKKLEKYIEDNGISGFDIYSDTKRYYPEKNIISHVIGFTGIDNEAREGLEKYLDPYLKGIPGKTLSGQDRKGRELSFDINNRIEEKDGLNAVLTIDINIQRMVSDALDNAIIKHKISDGACAIAMDPWTGEILAMVSKPDFDSNSPWSKPYGYKGEWSGYTQKDVNYLYRNNWKNKSIQETYEPGSTFKAITLSSRT